MILAGAFLKIRMHEKLKRTAVLIAWSGRSTCHIGPVINFRWSAKKGMVQFWVAASSAAWGWQTSRSGATIPRSFGFEAATRNGTKNQCYPESDLSEPCPKKKTIPHESAAQICCWSFALSPGRRQCKDNRKFDEHNIWCCKALLWQELKFLIFTCFFLSIVLYRGL